MFKHTSNSNTSHKSEKKYIKNKMFNCKKRQQCVIIGFIIKNKGEIFMSRELIIKKCLKYDKNKRITAEEALKHEFFVDDINPHNIFSS